jgi:hypothetical protein
MAYLDKIRNWSAAVAFAEAGEVETACQMADVPKDSGRLLGAFFKAVEKTFMAAAFAEEGLHKEAIRALSPAPMRRLHVARPSFPDIVGLRNAPVYVYVTTV